MTLPRRAVGQSGHGGRGYRPLGHKKSIILPSVTTILKGENKPALQQFSADQTAAYAIASGEKLLTMSDAVAFKMLRWYFKRAPKDPLSGDVDLNDYHTGVVSDAAELGDSVHEWIEADLSGTTPFPDVSNRNDAFWECVTAWNEFKSQHDIVYHRTENTVWDEREDGLGYAGTFDLEIEIDGKLYLIDIKTSRGLYTSTWMQLSALYNARYLLDDSQSPGIDAFIDKWQSPITNLGVIHVRPGDWTSKGEPMDPFCKLVEMPGDHSQWFNGFLGLRQYSNMIKDTKSLEW